MAARYVAAVTHTTRSLRAWLLCHRAARLGCDGTRGLFSYHLPLHRLLATLVSFGAHTLQLPLDSLLPPCLDGAVPLKEDFILRLAKHPLRVLTLLSQTRSSYWVRNGHAASKPATLYRSPTFGELFMMPDLMLLQYCLLRLGTARFVGLGLATFALRSFLPGLVSASQPPLAYPAVDHSDRPLAPGVAPGDPTPLAEDFLTLLVMLVNERSPCASADRTPISSTPGVSQPGALSGGQTVVTETANIEIKADRGQLVQIPASPSLAEVVRALNAVGASPQDLLSILQAMRAAGALQAELEII